MNCLTSHKYYTTFLTSFININNQKKLHSPKVFKYLFKYLKIYFEYFFNNLFEYLRLYELVNPAFNIPNKN